MRNPFSGHSSIAGLIALLFIYVMLIVLVLVFANQVLMDISLSRGFFGNIIIPLAAVFMFVLIGTIIFNIVKLFRERAQRKPGIFLKIRLIIFFVFIAVVSSLPQSLLSINFIGKALDTWFSANMSQAIEGGLHIALEYYGNKIETIEKFSNSSAYNFILRDIVTNPDRLWENLNQANPDIRAVQVFASDGKEVLFRGDGIAKISFQHVANRGEGLMPKETVKATSILRTVKKYVQRDEAYIVVTSVLLPEGFEKNAELLTSSLERFTQLTEYQRFLLIGIFVFYLFFALPILLLAILSGFLLTEEIIRPIANMEEAIKRVADGDFSFRILTRSKDELSLLVSSFNKMVSELERSRVKIMQTEKVAAWQEIAQRLAHEIKNPLTPIKLSAERILRKYQTNKEEIGKVLEPAVTAIIQEVDNLNQLLLEFRDFAKLPVPVPIYVNLKELIRETVDAYAAGMYNIRFDITELQENIIISVDPKQIKQVFSNLFKNAIEAMPEGGGSVSIRSDLVKKGKSNYCRVQVQDTGIGIAAEYRDKVFNPYFTTKTHGTGLGLSIIERIVFDHKGQIWFETEENVGTTFFIDLPMEK